MQRHITRLRICNFFPRWGKKIVSEVISVLWSPYHTNSGGMQLSQWIKTQGVVFVRSGEERIPNFTVLTLGLNQYLPGIFTTILVWAVLIFVYGTQSIYGRAIIACIFVRAEISSVLDLLMFLGKISALFFLSQALEFSVHVPKLLVVAGLYKYLLEDSSLRDFIWQVTNIFSYPGHIGRLIAIVLLVETLNRRLPELSHYYYFIIAYTTGLAREIRQTNLPLLMETVTVLLFFWKLIHYLQFFTFIELNAI